MEIGQLEDAVREIGAKEGGDAGLKSLLTKLGQYSSLSTKEGKMDDDTYDEAMADTIAGLAMIVGHMAVEQGVDLNEALEDRTEFILDDVREKQEHRADINEAMNEGDYKATARLMGFVEREEQDNSADDTRFFQ